MSRIAVIGAGMAGLTAARGLSRANREAVVFDKARGVGGRTSTRRRDARAFDHGAQYVTQRSNEAFARQLEDWCRRGVASLWDAPITTLGAGEISSRSEQTRRHVGVPGMNAMARDLARELTVECGRRIERIEGTARSWHLIAEDGATDGPFETVVVATPAPQAAPLLAVAPRLAELASGVEMQACHAVMVTFSESLGVAFAGAFVSASPLSWVVRNTSKPERPVGECWVLHSSPEWSLGHLEENSETVAGLLLQAFAAALGRALPRADSSAVHLWRFARTARPLGTGYLWDSAAGLGVCGDWMLGDRVEDAFTSGELLADAILCKADSPARAS